MSNKARGGRALMLSGVLIGVALGAVVALVYTPHNGKQNRNNLNQWAHNRLSSVRGKTSG